MAMNHGSVSGASGCTSIECQPARFAPTMSVRNAVAHECPLRRGHVEVALRLAVRLRGRLPLACGYDVQGEMLDQLLSSPVGAVGDDAETLREESAHHLDVRQELLM